MWKWNMTSIHCTAFITRHSFTPSPPHCALFVRSYLRAYLQHCNRSMCGATIWIDHSISFSLAHRRLQDSFHHSHLFRRMSGPDSYVCEYVDECVCMSTISYANETISLSTWHYLIRCQFIDIRIKDCRRTTIVMKFHFYLYAVPEVGNQQHSTIFSVYASYWSSHWI